MIQLSVPDFCGDCSEFEPDVCKQVLHTEYGEIYETMIRCVNENRCMNIAGYLSKRMEDAKDECSVCEDSEVITTSEEAPKQKTFITKHDLLVISAYTGYLMCDFNELHKFVEETLKRSVLTHEFADSLVIQEIQKALEPEWRRIIESLKGAGNG